MPPAKKTQKSKIIKVEGPKVLYPEQLKVVYSNYASFVLGLNDIAIDFGILDSSVSPRENKPAVQMSTRLIMSPQQSKIFSEKLSGLIKQYEEDIGEIITQPKKK